MHTEEDRAASNSFAMTDLAFLLLAAVLFGLSLAYVRFLDRLVHHPDSEAEKQ